MVCRRPKGPPLLCLFTGGMERYLFNMMPGLFRLLLLLMVLFSSTGPSYAAMLVDSPSTATLAVQEPSEAEDCCPSNCACDCLCSCTASLRMLTATNPAQLHRLHFATPPLAAPQQRPGAVYLELIPKPPRV